MKAASLVAWGALLAFAWSPPALALTKVKVAWCSKTINIAVAPFAVAEKMGWFAERGIDVELVPLNGSTECVQKLATGEVMFSDSTAEPLATIRAHGVNGKVFYTILQRNIFGVAVPADSPIQGIADLKGKTVGVTSMASTGVLIARAVVAASGLDPDRDINLVVIGEAGQSAAMLRNRQVDALSQFAPQYALIEMAGIKLRRLDNSVIDRFPSNGLAALDKTLVSRRNEAIALARGFAMGNLFSMTNPAAAIKIVYELYPDSRPPGRDEQATEAINLAVMRSTDFSTDIRKIGIPMWGESVLSDYRDYLAFLHQLQVVKSDIPVDDFVTNDLIADANDFDANAVVNAALTFK
jgi:NitT/TauT family transport system substrate-binding protein